MAEKLLEVKNLRTEFKRDKTWVTAVNNVSFSIQPGEILGLVGESGCGKSVTSLSIMKLLARNSKISNGEILLNGKDLLKEDKKGMRKIRGREVAMIFQEPMNSLNPCMKIEKQLTEAILLHNTSALVPVLKKALQTNEYQSVGLGKPIVPLKKDLLYLSAIAGGGQGLAGNEDRGDLHLQRGQAKPVQVETPEINDDGDIHSVLVTTRNQITLHVIDNFGTIRELA